MFPYDGNTSLLGGNPLNKARKPFQKVLLVIAAISYLAGALCGFAVLFMSDASNDPVAASLMASVVFFVGVGIVLQVMGSGHLPDLKVK